jgi:hypothetical protein
MAIDRDLGLETALAHGDEWQSWRALRLGDENPGAPPSIPAQDGEGGFIGPGGRPSPGATGEGLSHLVVLGLGSSGPAVVAADWLQAARTPAEAWLDHPDEVPGVVEAADAGRVWATASAVCALLAARRDSGSRALELLRGEEDQDGRFTGGAYPTFAAAGAFWLADGPKTEVAEWALRWARESEEDWWGPWEWATALTFWGAAGVPIENPTVELFIDNLREAGPAQGWPDDLGLTLRTLELMTHFGA